MLGTEAKIGEAVAPESDRNGLAARPRQGQKGIGRLSVAYLGPTVLVLTRPSPKRVSQMRNERFGRWAAGVVGPRLGRWRTPSCELCAQRGSDGLDVGVG